MNWLILADVADTLFGAPFWEQPDRLASPGMIAIGVFAYSLWKVWKGTSSAFSKISETLTLLQQHLPAIIAALKTGQQVVPPPSPAVTPPAAQVPPPPAPSQ